MTDLSKTIAPKSDQMNADDLIGGPITLTVTRVTGDNDPAQPISIHSEHDDGRPYKPCKSMRRVMVAAWGKDGNKYAGRSMTLFCDPTVKFGGIAVGGVRISHMSHIDSDLSIGLTAKRGQRKPFHVKKLVIADASEIAADAPPNYTVSGNSPSDFAQKVIARMSGQGDHVAFEVLTANDVWLANLKRDDPALFEQVNKQAEAEGLTITPKRDAA